MRWVSAFLVLVVFASFFVAGGQAVINSADWKFVFAASLYAKQNDLKSDFLLTAVTAPTVMKAFDSSQEIVVFESSKNAIIPNFKADVERSRFKVKEVVSAEDGDALAFELARRNNAKSFVVVDGTYGHPAILALPYAIASNSSLLFSDIAGPQKIVDFLKERKAERVVVFGTTIKQAVIDALSPFNPKVLRGEDRFDDNFLILKELKQVTGRSLESLILTDAAFFESGFTGVVPIMLIGSSVSSQKVKDFIKQENITMATLVGPHLIDSAKNIKETTGLKSIFLRFGKASVERTTGFAQPQALDIFLIPTVIFDVSVKSVALNSVMKELEVTFASEGNVPTLVKANGDLFVGGARVGGFSTLSPSLIFPKNELSVTYPVEFSVDSGSQALKASILLSFGESVTALDASKKVEVENVSRVAFTDDSTLSVQGVFYDKGSQRFEVDVKNPGVATVYVKPTLSVKLAGDPLGISVSSATAVQPGGSASIPLPRALSETELKALSATPVKMVAYYGKREKVLTKTKSQEFMVELRSSSILGGLGVGADVLPYALGLVVLIVLVFVLFKLKNLFSLGE